jgi:hypothetical protein
MIQLVSVKLRDTNVARMVEHTKGKQQPYDDTDYHDNIQDILDFAIHRDVIIDEPKQHADDNQCYDKRN